MARDENNPNTASWNLRKQPTLANKPLVPGLGLTSSFRTLLVALDQGWRIEEPVQVLPSVRLQLWTYYFVITHRKLRQTCRLFVPAVPEVEHFVEQGDYQVIEGSYY